MDNNTHKAYSFISHLLASDQFKSNVGSIIISGGGLQLMVMTLYLLLKPSLSYQLVEMFFVLLAVTSAVTVAMLYTLNILTAPVSLMSAALDEFLSKEELPDLPGDLTDEAGKLMAQVQQLMMTNHTLRYAVEKAALLDPLTGVYNRHWCETQITRELERLEYADEMMTIIAIDLDDLRSINEVHGQRSGDLCLKHVANTLRFNVRGIDWIARWGDDEFLLVVYNLPSESVVKLVERIRRTVKDRPIPTPQGDEIHLSISIGVCRYFEGDDLESVTYKIDKALVHAKLYGKDQLIQDYLSLAG
jgi:diguanylate cyclase (GGDEF)-like protein